MNRERLLISYALAVGVGGWLWLLITPLLAPPLVALILFIALAVTIDLLGFRAPPADTYSLSGIVLLTAALALGPGAGALIAAIAGLISGMSIVLLANRPRSLYLLLARPLMRGGIRAIGILAGAALAELLSERPQTNPATLDHLPLLICILISFTVLLQLGRIGRELLQGGQAGLTTWWLGTWRLALGVELAPLPLALLGAAIYTRLGEGYLLLAGSALIAAAAAVRRATLNLDSQRRSVRELALLNEVSRAIIRSELDVATLCELIYREASKIVDTASFHLGLFDGDSYTLVVHVQDRVRLPALTVDMGANDGLIGWMRQTGKALLVEDFTKEMAQLPARPRYQSERPPRSGIYVPLIAGDHVEQVLGSISVQSYQPSAFGANDLRLLSLIADQAAVAITRARAFREASVRAVQLQAIHEVSERITAILDLDLLLPAVVRLIREHFGYHPVHIFTIKPDETQITFRASTSTGAQLTQVLGLTLSAGQGIVGAAVTEGGPILVGDVQREPRYIPDSRTTRSELAVPLRIGEQVVGVLDVQSDEVDDFDADDLFVMQTLADQIAVAIDSANSYRAQQEEAWTLNALLQVAENLGQATSLEALLDTAVRLPTKLIGATRTYLLLWEEDEQQFRVEAIYGLPPDLHERLLGQAIALDQAVLLTALRQAGADGQRLLTLHDTQRQPDLWPQLLAAGLSGSLIAMPLVGRMGLLGAFILDFDDNPHLNERQLNLCVGVAGQVAGTLESLLLAGEAEAAARFEQELRVAREIQTALLPASPPSLPGWQIDTAWRSARLVGGDFFDFWTLPISKDESAQMDEEALAAREVGRVRPNDADDAALPLPTHPAALGFVIADVSDKGVPAAMFMALSRSLVRAAALDGSSPPRAMERANRWITRDSESAMFVTLFYGILEPQSGRLRYTVAGHNPPIHYRAADGSMVELRTPGIALGVLEEIQLNEAETELAPGDVLVCYTDGVTETVNDALEEFGVERLRRLLARHHHDRAEVIVRLIIEAVTRHGHGHPPFDDVTLVVLKREPA